MNSKPSLEFYTDDDHGESRRVEIEGSPFRIGRAESADLRIESVEISREHAEIFERNGLWLVRDLGSTNGTQVNGKTISEVLLTDGDIVQVAATELTFVASACSQFQRMLTQPISATRQSVASPELPAEVVATRTMIEALLWQVIPTRWLVATSLRLGGSEALFAPVCASPTSRLGVDSRHAIGERYREIEWMRLVDAVRPQDDTRRLFLGIDATDMETSHRLFTSLRQVQGWLPKDWELGITLSLPTDVDILRISEVYQQAREHELLVAFDEFQGNGGQVMHLDSLLPDYLILAASMTKDLTSSRQPLRRLESLREACEDLAMVPVLPPIQHNHAISLCQELGFDLMLQPSAGQQASREAELVASH